MTTQNAPKGSGRLMKWVLWISLALNLVVVGLVVGAMIRFSSEGGKAKFSAAQLHQGAPFVRALPKEAAGELRRALRQDRADMPTRAERRAQFEQMVVLLQADTFDRSAMEDVFSQQAQAAQAMRDRAQSEWLDLISAMSAEERALVADRLKEGLKRNRPPKPPRN